MVTGGPTVWTINPNTDFSSTETVTVTVFANKVTDQDSDDPPDNMAADYLFDFGVAVDVAPTAVDDAATVAEDSGANAIDVFKRHRSRWRHQVVSRSTTTTARS